VVDATTTAKTVKTASRPLRTAFVQCVGMKALADTGAVISGCNTSGLNKLRPYILSNETCNIKVKAVSGALVDVTQRFMVRLPNKRQGWVHLLPEMSYELILGLNMIGGDDLHYSWKKGIMKVWDQGQDFTWKIWDSEASLPRDICLIRDRTFDPGTHEIDVSSLQLDGYIVEGSAIGSKDSIQFFVPDSYCKGRMEGIAVMVTETITIPAGTVIGRAIAPTVAQTMDIFSVAQVISEVKQEPFEDITSAFEAPPPIDGVEPDDSGPSWEAELNRKDISSDPGYRESEDFEELLETLNIRSKTGTWLNSIVGSMPNGEQEDLLAILRKYAHVWSTTITPVDPKFGVHRIITEDKPPAYTHQYPLKPEAREAIKVWARKLKKQDLIEFSDSDWCCPLLVVPKPDGSPRICFDARKLNLITKRDKFPVSNAQQCLRKLNGSQLFSASDCLSGFWQILLDERDRKKTAFIAGGELYHHKVMPMGLVNASTTYCRVMNKVLGALQHAFVIYYIDDVLLHTKDADRRDGQSLEACHTMQLEALLSRLSKANLNLKATKTNLFMPQVDFLGHVISKDGLRMQPHKAKKILQAPRPKTRTQLKSWLGLINYYRHFLDNAAKKLAPLNALLRKEIPATFGDAWGEKHDTAFALAKAMLSTKPVLQHPDFSRPFEIHTDGSVEGLGAVLVQHDDQGREYAVEFASRSLNEAEGNYDTRELECLSLLFGIKKFRQFLGPSFTAVVDHMNLLRLAEYVSHNRRLARWALSLSEYDISLKHRPGILHNDADFMSRIAAIPVDQDEVLAILAMDMTSISLQDERDEKIFITSNSTPQATKVKLRAQPTAISAVTVEGKNMLFSPATVRREQLKDSFCKRVFLEIKDSNSQAALSFQKDSTGCLCFTGVRVASPENDVAKNIENRMVIPKSLQSKVLWNFHEHILAGHQSSQTMTTEITCRFYWKGMHADIKKHVQTCATCRKGKLTKSSRQDRLVSVLNRLPFSVLFCDHVEIPATNAEGYTHIVTMLCGFSNFLITELVKSTNSRAAISAIWNRVVCMMGRIPQLIVCDNGFDSHELRKACKEFGISKVVPTAPYNPKANKVERPHRFLNGVLRMLVDAQDQAIWPELLQTATSSHNRLKHDGKPSPFELIFGMQPLVPLDTILFPRGSPIKLWEEEDYLSHLTHQLRNNYVSKRNQDLKNADARIGRALNDPARRAANLQPGDLVLLRSIRHGFQNNKKRFAKKLIFQCTGPHTIISKSDNSDMYTIKLGKSSITKRVAGKLLKLLPNRIRPGKAQNLGWLVDSSNYIQGLQSLWDIVAFRPPANVSRLRHFNVILGEIVGLQMDPKLTKPVRVRVFLPSSLQGSKRAHLQSWYPTSMSEANDIVIHKGGRRGRSAGKTFCVDLAWKDILPIPPIILEADNKIPKILQKKILQSLPSDAQDINAIVGVWGTMENHTVSAIAKAWKTTYRWRITYIGTSTGPIFDIPGVINNHMSADAVAQLILDNFDTQVETRFLDFHRHANSKISMIGQNRLVVDMVHIPITTPPSPFKFLSVTEQPLHHQQQEQSSSIPKGKGEKNGMSEHSPPILEPPILNDIAALTHYTQCLSLDDESRHKAFIDAKVTVKDRYQYISFVRKFNVANTSTRKRMIFTKWKHRLSYGKKTRVFRRLIFSKLSGCQLPSCTYCGIPGNKGYIQHEVRPSIIQLSDTNSGMKAIRRLQKLGTLNPRFLEFHRNLNNRLIMHYRPANSKVRIIDGFTLEIRLPDDSRMLLSSPRVFTEHHRNLNMSLVVSQYDTLKHSLDILQSQNTSQTSKTLQKPL
jgi:hypothetical protein